jgi:hypothetical protein
MDILIKSFNRPYYLDRCLHSIEKYVKGADKITILDDGTPQIYLDKIKAKYQNVTIKKSEFYEQKQIFTLNGIRPNEYSIPINFWFEAAKNASENFIIIEDDFWFIDFIDLSQVNDEINNESVVFLKLIWIGSPMVIQSKEAIQKDSFVVLKPKLFTTIPFLYYFIFYKFDRFKIRKTLRFLKINTQKKHLAYYTIYSVAGMIFNRDYFVNLWNNHENKIDEGLQIHNALKFLRKQKKKIQFARYNNQILRTGFMSSATSQYKERFGENIDMFVFNKIMNEAWLMDKMDVTSSLPKDIDQEVITSILDDDAEKRILSKNWIVWMNNFKKQYESIGCKIDW